MLVIPEDAFVKEVAIVQTPPPVDVIPEVTERDLLVADVLAFFPEHYRVVVQRDIAGVNEAALVASKICAEAILSSSRNDEMPALLQAMTEVSKGLLPEGMLAYIAQRVDRFSDELGFVAIKYLYVNTMDGEGNPPSDEIFESHMYAVTNHNSYLTRAHRDHSYLLNGPLMAFVSKHPDRVDLILKHHSKYYVHFPWDEENKCYPETEYRLDILETDFDELAGVHAVLDEGWL